MPVNKVRRIGSYAPLSAHYYKDDAIADAGEAAELLYVRGLAFCADVLSDGFISETQLSRFVGVGMKSLKARATRLVEVGLWSKVAGGYNVVTWLKWNRSRDDIANLNKKDAGRKVFQGQDSNDLDPPEDAESERNPNGIQPDSDSGSESSPNGFHPRARNTDQLHDRATTEPDSLRSSDTLPLAIKDAPKKPRKKPAVRLPDDWKPNSTHAAYATKNGLSLDGEVFKFRNHAHSTDRSQADWNASFNTWLARAIEYRTPRQAAAAGPFAVWAEE